MLILRAFSTFSKASGLCMSPAKSDIYFAGVNTQTRQDILQISGCKEGSLPFKYLGIRITAGRLSVMDCNVLNEKIVKRIRDIGTRKLSYAGRLTLVKAVLSNLHSYWARVFVLPKTVLRKIAATCRNFLWDGVENMIRTPLVAWEEICKDKNEGGLGIIDVFEWNKASIGKYVAWLYSKADSMWIKWIHSIYLKGQHWGDYTPPEDSSWHWKKLCKVKDQIKNFCAHWEKADYTPAKCYKWLKGVQPRVGWDKIIWGRHTIPRTSFIAWLATKERLQVKEKLWKLGISENDQCLICCRGTESHQHLFFKCAFSSQCLQILKSKLGIMVPDCDVINWCTKKSFNSRIKRQVTGALICSLMYFIWYARNKCRHELVLWLPDVIMEKVWSEVKHRLRHTMENLSAKDRNWLADLDLL